MIDASGNCPVQAVYDGGYDDLHAGDDEPNHWKKGRLMGLSDATIKTIVAAADDYATAKPRVRRDILAACGLA